MPAGLQISQARIKNRRLVVRGSLDRTAAGQRLELRFRAKARQIILRPRVRANGRFAVTRRLGGPLRNVTGGRLQVKFRGTARLRAAQERLWVARRPVNLRLIRIRYRGGRVEVAGKIDRRARKPVRILLEFVRADGRPAQVAKQARVDRKGRFQTQLRVGPAAGTGAWLSASHPGQGPLHGQRTGRMIRR